eukprot:CAMPEP_0174260270 /NCGR_PEP_ID=MMETSP0439-20130205/9456_1 /TAXON_ID=0 /ORGANISM="Stereomyxa ramosa, Strain Chinc5" /LENGTH=349 /DNA_ID=CAMNT_0015344483 /DNA_START=22 /DNA_END=1071 /DNA_ORIENTATION=+
MSVQAINNWHAITCHAWNANKTKIAFCPNNTEVHIYNKSGNTYTKDTVLTEHDSRVLGIDWAPNTNRLVTCSEDRNAYVWALENGQWKPTLVILRVNRAATCVKWSPDETKFAVSSGAKCVSVCYFEQENDWWVSKHIKKHKSTVTSVAWHPNSIILATCSSDFKCRLFSAFVSGCDQPSQNSPFPNSDRFGQPLAEYTAYGWVHCAAWSPSGNVLGFVSHDSSITFVTLNGGEQRIPLNNLPFRAIVFLDEGSAVAAGHDNNPMLFKNQGGQWGLVKEIDGGNAKKVVQTSAASQARQMFENKATMGTDTNETTLSTLHQNAISCIQRFGNNQISTTGVDGKLVIWNV